MARSSKRRNAAADGRRRTAYPHELRQSTQHAERAYRLADDGFAVLDSAAAAATPVEQRLQTDDGQQLLVVRCAPGAMPAGALRIYLDTATGQWRVPSGLVFVRFSPGVTVESRRDVLQQAGYRIRSALPYAPEAAWLEDATGNAARALAGIAALEALPGMENVEPQWLAARQAK